MAHEFGHAVQARAATLDRDVPTIYTEQQADCFSGAWARRVWEGQAGELSFGDDDIRSGLIALVAVADPIGTSVLEPGGHGAAFDRIGAFQWGFVGGVDNCVSLIDQPLPLLPNEFAQGGTDQLTNGDARFGWQPGEIMDLLTKDLTVFWPPQVAANGTTMPIVTLRPISDPNVDNCADPEAMANFGAVYCAATNEVLFDESAGQRALRRLRRLRRWLCDRSGLGRSRPDGARQQAWRASPERWRRTVWSGRGSAHGSSSTREPGRPRRQSRRNRQGR